MARANAAYYATHDPFADFTTAPEISQVFGEILGLWAAVTWDQMGRPDPVLLVEAGPGRGTLMADALRAIARVAPGFARRAAAASDRDLAAAARDPGGAAAGCDLARRPGDAAGRRRFCCWPTSSSTRCRSASSSGAATQWTERFVADGGFVEVKRAPPSNLPPLPRGGGTGDGEDAMARSSRSASLPVAFAHRWEPVWPSIRGAALFLDYGPERSGPGDSLQAVRDGRPADPLAEPGTADLTAHVDFAAFAAAAREAGAAVHGPLAAGHASSPGSACSSAPTGWRAPSRPRGAIALIDAARRLAEPDRMGRLFKALAVCHPACPPLRDSSIA